MPLIISHDTALEYLRSVPQLRYPGGELGPLDLDKSNADYPLARKVDWQALGIRRRPFDVLVGPGVKQSQGSQVRSHSFGMAQLPSTFVRCLSEDVYYSRSELVFIQMARQLDLPHAVALGCEFCGEYSHFSASVRGFYERPHLTMYHKLASKIDELEGLRGLGAVRRAHDLVVPGARSPMETFAALMLSFPGVEGGFGFEKPLLNHRVDFDEAAASVAGSRFCLVDLAWPSACFGIEYNGDEFHQDPVHDRKRIEALGRMGWSVVTLDARDVGSMTRFKKVAASLEGRVPRKDDGCGDARKQRELYDQLLDATRWGWGLEDALFGVPVQRGSVRYHL